MPSSLKSPKARPSCVGSRRSGKLGVLRRRQSRTTCEISQLANRLVDAARPWLPATDADSNSKGAFVDRAVFELTDRLLRENADFKLPPELASEFIAVIKPNAAENGNR